MAVGHRPDDRSMTIRAAWARDTPLHAVDIIRRTPQGRVIGYDDQVPGFILRLEDARQSDQNPVRTGWVSAGEVFRSLFGVSSEFLSDLIKGSTDEFRGAKSPLLDKRRNRFDPESKVCELFASRRLTREEGFVGAMLVSDRRLAAAAGQPFKRFGKATPQEKLAGVSLSMPWPFSSSVQMTVTGRWVVTRTNGHRFVVTRILGLALDPPFSRIVVHRPGSTPELAMLQLGAVAQPVKSQEPVTLVTGAVPGTRQPPVAVRTGSVHLTDMSAIQIEEIVETRGLSGERMRVVAGELLEAEAATADANAHGDPDLSYAVVERRQARIRDATKSLECVEDRLRAEALSKTLTAVEGAAGQLGFRVEIKERLEDGFALICMLTDRKTGRQIVVADAGSTNGDPKSLGALANEEGLEIVDSHLDHVYWVLAMHGGKWRSSKAAHPGLRLVAMNRSGACWSNSNHYELRMVELLSQLMHI